MSILNSSNRIYLHNLRNTFDELITDAVFHNNLPLKNMNKDTPIQLAIYLTNSIMPYSDTNKTNNRCNNENPFQLMFVGVVTMADMEIVVYFPLTLITIYNASMTLLAKNLH